MTLSKGICQQEDSMAAQLRGDHVKLARLLDVTSDERGADAGEWEIQYMGNGLPLFKHTKSGFRTFDKPMFVYGEPSHFFLTYGAFILYFLINSKFKNIFMLCLLFFLTQIKSAVLAIQLLIYSFLSYKKYFFIFLLVLTVPITLSFDYYYSRIDFFSDNRSLSVNAFVSGVMRAYMSLFETNLLGFDLILGVPNMMDGADKRTVFEFLFCFIFKQFQNKTF